MDGPVRTDATAPVPEEQLEALREEIRRAGVLQIRAGACVFALIFGLVLAGAMLSISGAGPMNPSLATGVASTAGIIAVAGGAWLVGKLRRLSKGLLALEVRERARLLEELGSSRHWGTRDIVRDLRSRLPSGREHELVPIAAPTSRGDEPTPAP